MSGDAYQTDGWARLGGPLSATGMRSAQRRKFTGVQGLRDGRHQKHAGAQAGTPYPHSRGCRRSRLAANMSQISWMPNQEQFLRIYHYLAQNGIRTSSWFRRHLWIPELDGQYRRHRNGQRRYRNHGHGESPRGGLHRNSRASESQINRLARDFSASAACVGPRRNSNRLPHNT